MIDFSKAYNRDNFLRFLEQQFLPDDFTTHIYPIEFNSFKPRFAQEVYKLGSSEILELDIYEITHSSTHDARVGIAQDAFKLMLHESFNNRALIIFVPENSKQFRFSLLEIEATQDDNSSRVQLNYSNPRRYSFLLGERAQIKTPAQFLLQKGPLKEIEGSYINDLQNRFSVEVLTKLFYKELQDWYFWAIKVADFPNDIEDAADNKQHNNDNIIRLITRLIFVWFVKHKGLINDALFNLNDLNKILKDFKPESTKQNNYYRAILQNLFFATLNQEMDKRGFAQNKGFDINRQTYNIKNLYRYEDEFINKDTNAIMQLFKEIPFLNGGLFECLDNKEHDGKIYYWDGFSRRKDRQANLPNHLFFSQEQIVDLSADYDDKKMSTVKVTGIIEILNKYNFTVEENTPAEVEVALDPELLGKVFENLLASYNPETKTTARNQTGSFYTPREIVTYMVNESLIEYYRNKVPEIKEEQLRELLAYQESELDISETVKQKLVNATFNCKIIDPACGSGAFPMGALQQMVHVLSKLDPDNQHWQDIVMEQALQEFENITDKKESERLKEDIYQTFDKNVNHPDYARKLYLIENSIYGIDIQSIAVQISKLRFFISLICEQISDVDADNYGIRPLPNLETKFVVADTLRSIEKPAEDMQYFNDDKIKKLVDKLQKIRHKQFSVTNVTDKKGFRKRDKEVRQEIVTEVSQLYKKHADDNIENYKKQLKKLEFELDLLANQDDVIRTIVEADLFGIGKTTQVNITEQKRANINKQIERLQKQITESKSYSRLGPIVTLAKQLTSWDPYDQNAVSPFFDPEWMFGLDSSNNGYFDIVIGNPPYVVTKQSDFPNYKWGTDLYKIFFEASITFLRENGICCFITPIFFLVNKEDSGMREFFIKQIDLVSLSSCTPFEAVVTENVISLFYKREPTRDQISAFKHHENRFVPINDVDKRYALSNTYNEIILGISKEVVKLLSKITKNCIPLQEISTSKRGAEVSKKYSKNLNEGQAILIGEDVQKYTLKWNYTYLEKNHKEYKRLNQFFRKTDIYLRRVDKQLTATISLTEQYGYTKNIYGINVKDGYNPLYILALLNSKLLNYYYKNKFSTKKEDVFPEIQTYLFEQLPIFKAKKYIQDIISNISRIALIKKGQDNFANISSELNQIDNLIFKLYNLTYEEVKVIDPDSELTEEEYKRIEIN